MASFITTHRGEEEAMPQVRHAPLVEGFTFEGDHSGTRWRHQQVRDERLFTRRWADDVRAEFRRAAARRNFFTYWHPEEN